MKNFDLLRKVNKCRVLAKIVGFALFLVLSTLCVYAPVLNIIKTNSKIYADSNYIVSRGSCGENVTYTLDNAGTLTISGTGNMFNYSSDTMPWKQNRYSIKTVNIENGVMSIGNCAFYKCENLINITIPDSVSKIGYSVFYECSNIVNITIPEGVTSIGNYTFFHCHNLTEITIPDSVTSIGYYAFYNCENLIKLTIPDSVTSIGYDAFSRCSSLKKISIPKGLTKIDNYMFSGCSSLSEITIPYGVVSIGYDAFSGCSSLTEIKIPEGVTSIENYTFSGCNNLTKITLPEGLTSIGARAFNKCSSLTEITIPNGVISIGSSAFYNCSSLTEIEIPEGVTNIGNYAFYGCNNLTNITIPEGLTSIGNYSFYECRNLTNVAIPEGVTSIGSYAFYNCSSIRDIVIPERVTSIENYTFYGCNNLSSLMLAEGVKNIGSYAFYGCSNLREITIPEEVTNIGTYAFYGCCNLREITIPYGVTRIEDYTFAESSCLTNIILPEGLTIIGSGAFYRCSNLQDISMPEGVKGIGLYAFYECSSLTYIEIPNGVKIVESEMFSGCTSLRIVSIPNTVTSIRQKTFYSCNSLEYIKYNGTDSQWAKIGGVDSCSLSSSVKILTCSDNICDTDIFYCVNDSTLFIYSNGNQNSKMIDFKSAFDVPWEEVSNTITQLVLLPDITYIGNYAFRLFSNLQKVIVNNKDLKIGSYCFPDSNNVDLTFEGIGGQFINDYIRSKGYKQTKYINPETPIAPALQSKTDSSITLVPIDGYEYKCGSSGEWQRSNVFEGLLEYTSYSFYQRIAENLYYLPSIDSVPITINTRSNTPQPSVYFKTDNCVVLVDLDGYEYSMNGYDWQDSHEFRGLNANTQYSFYQRRKSTSNAGTSVSSEPLIETTNNNALAPTKTTYSDTSVTLALIEGYEYKCDEGEWQDSNIFTNLCQNTQYNFYQRLKVSNKLYCYNSSPSLSLKTLAIPDKPSVSSNSGYSITIVPINGMEYKCDDGEWQDSNVFTSLSSFDTHMFYQRVKETETNGTTAASDALKLIIVDAPEVCTLSKYKVTLVAHSGYEYSIDGVNWTDCNELNIEPTETTLYQRPKSDYLSNNVIEAYYVNSSWKNSSIMIDSSIRILIGISINKEPTKIEYPEGKRFDPSGMEVTAYYDDGTIEVVTNYTYSPNSALQTKNNQITISYSENGIIKTVTQSITVNEKRLQSIAITKAPNNTSYTEKQVFSNTGMEVTAYYDNDTSAVVSDYTYSPTGELTTSDNKITVSYTESGITKTVDQAVTVHKPYVFIVHDSSYSLTVYTDISSVKLLVSYFNTDGRMLYSTIRDVSVVKGKEYIGELNQNSCKIFLLDSNYTPIIENWSGKSQ